MSRSYKYNTYVTDNHGKNLRRRYFKRYYNHSLRNKLKNSDELIQGSDYKKHCNSYTICDYRWYWSEDMAIDDYYERLKDEERSGLQWFTDRYPTLESWLKYWRKCVKWK